MEWPLEDLRYPVSEAWKAWKTVRKGRDVPSMKQLPEMFELLHKDVFRQTYSCLSPVSSSDQDESADVAPLSSSPWGGNLTRNDVGTGNDHVENELPDSSEHPSPYGETEEKRTRTQG
ncbi:hypothetical protein FOQG_04188 [Fusarium oxysporum f. sp. raphani 54005]|uniref:Uncharacterized protein n=2 Tax=Fusarium oxysporum f. sp. raphani TaxID=96318 RepID=X0CWG2_FUSOX|nr:hypothetical protein FOQG_04188 [Fusarium oxysporum f. sp. raphani 54005]KAG7433389.1 hypothetical protein Forpi1262_v006887 [Fusarium oxysporum f. sp. raphani]